MPNNPYQLIVEANTTFNEVIKGPGKRIEWVSEFFGEHQGSVIVKTSILSRCTLSINYGVDIVKFMEWERNSDRLGDENG